MPHPSTSTAPSVRSLPVCPCGRSAALQLVPSSALPRAPRNFSPGIHRQTECVHAPEKCSYSESRAPNNLSLPTTSSTAQRLWSSNTQTVLPAQPLRQSTPYSRSPRAPLSSIIGSAACMARKVPRTFTPYSRSSSSGVVESSVPICEMPALFTRMSTGPPISANVLRYICRVRNIAAIAGSNHCCPRHNRRRGGCGLHRIEIDQHDLRPMRRERLCNRQPDPARSNRSPQHAYHLTRTKTSFSLNG